MSSIVPLRIRVLDDLELLLVGLAGHGQLDRVDAGRRQDADERLLIPQWETGRVSRPRNLFSSQTWGW